MLALIAGTGALPKVIVSSLDREGQVFQLCELEGFPSQARGDRPIIRFRVETIGSFLSDLIDSGVSEVCFAGAIGRPKLDPSAIDPQTMPLVPRMMAALQAGDDAALKAVMGFFEEVGVKVRAAHEIVPDLLPASGVLSGVQPTDQDVADVARGQEILRAMGQADVGQACIVANGQALAIETIGGTDWMLQSLLRPQGWSGLADWSDPVGIAADWLSSAEDNSSRLVRDPHLPEGGLLMKACKPKQDRRIDMPTIGPTTFMLAAEAGLRGVVIEAGGVQVLDLPQCLDLARGQNLLFWVHE